MCFLFWAGVRISAVARIAVNNSKLPGVLIEYKKAASTGNYDHKVTTDSNGMALLGTFERGTKLEYKASKKGYFPRTGDTTTQSSGNKLIINMELSLSLIPKEWVCKC